MDRRNFINASALCGIGLFSQSLKSNDFKQISRVLPIDEDKTINFPEKKIPVIYDADVVVVGAGPAGFGAAMKAARIGMSTVLIERFGGPGGAATSGYMCVTGQGSSFPLHAEWVEGLQKEGWLFDAWKAYPWMENNVLVHQSGRYSFYPDDGAYVMNEMLEKAKVKLLYRTSYIDSILERDVSGENKIEAIIVHNNSGLQAIKGKIFIDSTGVADVVAQSGSPFISPGNKKGQPVPPSLMYKISGVDYEKLYNYQKEDPALWDVISKARVSGDISDDFYLPYQFEIGGGWGGYRGCPQLNMCAIRGNGEMLVWGYPPNDLALNLAENGFDASRGEIEMRKINIAEVKFLKKYVPGFENAYLSGMAPYMAIREGRHPQGEYVLSYEDIINESKFDDAVLQKRQGDPLEWNEDMKQRPNEKGEMVWKKTPRKERRSYNTDIPFRALLPKEINNLILAGECLSSSYEWFYGRRLIPWCMRTGEVAGTAASIAIMNSINAKEVKWNFGYYKDDIL